MSVRELDPGAVPTDELLIDDQFDRARGGGQVIGTLATSGAVRHGVDLEGVQQIDGGALRIRPLADPGWGRAGIAYGPLTPRPGLALAVHVLNGHHGAQGYEFASIRPQLKAWVRGSYVQPWWRRVPRLLTTRRRVSALRRIGEWRSSTKRRGPIERENLAVGWFASEVPVDPRSGSAAVIIRAADHDNGDLMVTGGEESFPVIEAIQNVPLHVVAILREDSVLVLAGSVPNSTNLPAYPELRPLAIVPFDMDHELYAGIQQCVMGEIGFSLDTRVYDTRIADLPSVHPTYATAHLADTFVGGAPLGGSAAELGGTWSCSSGEIRLTERGPVADRSGALALLDPGAPTGLLHALVYGRPFALVWRASHDGSHVALECTDDHWVLATHSPDTRHILGEGRADPGGRVHVHDDGAQVRVTFGSAVVHVGASPHLPSGTGVGIKALMAEIGVLGLEGHPRSVVVPASLRVTPIPMLEASRSVVDDEFDGPASPLEGREVATGAWARTLGHGQFKIDRCTARIAATEEQPVPDRTIYTVPWPEPEFALTETSIVLPDSHGRARCRAGLTFVQDLDNMLILNVWTDDDRRPWASISTFFVIDGLEDVYDAVWTNIASRIDDGRPVDLSVGFDGLRYQVRLNGESVLWRSLRDVYPRARRMAINQVGLVANWEWGYDTGSSFQRFRAAGR